MSKPVTEKDIWGSNNEDAQMVLLPQAKDILTSFPSGCSVILDDSAKIVGRVEGVAIDIQSRECYFKVAANGRFWRAKESELRYAPNCPMWLRMPPEGDGDDFIAAKVVESYRPSHTDETLYALQEVDSQALHIGLARRSIKFRRNEGSFPTKSSTHEGSTKNAELQPGEMQPPCRQESSQQETTISSHSGPDEQHRELHAEKDKGQEHPQKEGGGNLPVLENATTRGESSRSSEKVPRIYHQTRRDGDREELNYDSSGFRHLSEHDSNNAIHFVQNNHKHLSDQSDVHGNLQSHSEGSYREARCHSGDGSTVHDRHRSYSGDYRREDPYKRRRASDFIDGSHDSRTDRASQCDDLAEYSRRRNSEPSRPEDRRKIYLPSWIDILAVEERILGKKGHRRKDMEYDFHCRIDLIFESRRVHLEALIEIIGEKSDVERLTRVLEVEVAKCTPDAFRAMYELAFDTSYHGNRENAVLQRVPPDYDREIWIGLVDLPRHFERFIAFIIGKGGEGLRRIQSRSRCTCRVESAARRPYIHIKGNTAEGVLQCRHLLIDKLSYWEKKDLCQNQPR